MNCIFQGIESEDLLFAISVACNVMGIKRREYRDNRNDIVSKGLLVDDEKDLVEFYNGQLSDIDLSREILLKIHDQVMVDVLKKSVNELKDSLAHVKDVLIDAGLVSESEG